MTVSDPTETVASSESAKESRGKTRAALIVSAFAALLAISTYGGSNATKDALKEDIAASNLYAFYQARRIHQTAYRLAADNLESALLQESTLKDSAKAGIANLIKTYRNEERTLASKPRTNDGMKELVARIKEKEKARDEALKKDPYFDYASAFMQIAIVLVSVSIITGAIALLWGGLLLGGLGLLAMLNGFFLFLA